MGDPQTCTVLLLKFPEEKGSLGGISHEIARAGGGMPQGPVERVLGRPLRVVRRYLVPKTWSSVMSVKLQPLVVLPGQVVEKSGTCGLSIQKRTY